VTSVVRLTGVPSMDIIIRNSGKLSASLRIAVLALDSLAQSDGMSQREVRAFALETLNAIQEGLK